jgi:hypothetical protein
MGLTLFTGEFSAHAIRSIADDISFFKVTDLRAANICFGILQSPLADKGTVFFQFACQAGRQDECDKCGKQEIYEKFQGHQMWSLGSHSKWGNVKYFFTVNLSLVYQE